ncbi:MAG: thermostable hemolysin [Gammaproteobacteria bacterium]|nr:thermostable hemolysin [Gammaproteobacteria bacterium]
MIATEKKRYTNDVPTSIRFYERTTDGRSAVEAFIGNTFQIAHNARIEQYLPTLMALGDGGGEPLAALGLRDADSEKLFLERYLDARVEEVMAAAVGSPVAREELVEVGNFAVGTAGGGRWLITALTAYLQATRWHWTVFTCGPMLQNAFHRLGIELLDLGCADPQRLSAEELQQWGGYYRSGPRVMAANVAQSRQALSLLLEREYALGLLWLGGCQAGRLAA